MGRVVFQLFADICPKTCENFRALCTGEMGIGKATGKPLHYQGTTFHRVVKSFMIQSGDFSDGNGKGGESIYNKMFEDEDFDKKHEEPFLLSMANKGPDTNGSQFFITTAPAPHLDNVHVVFGEVISGKEVVKEIEELQVDKKSRPLQDAKIIKCGELIPKKKQQEVSESEEESSSSSEDEEEKIKRRLKKQKKKEKKAAKKEKKKAKEEGEVEDGELHPLAQVTAIDPDSIPDVPSNRFLDRAPERKEDKYVDRDAERKDSVRVVGGKKLKGRGTMMFKRGDSGERRRRSRSRSRSRSRDRGRRREKSATPPHWRQAERRTISLKEYEKNKKDMERKEEERARREEERRDRHLARKAEDERQQREKEKRRLKETEERARNEEARKERRFRETTGPNNVSMDYDKLDFEGDEGEDEDALRLRALETQARNLIPNYGSPPRPRSASEDSSKKATTSKIGGRAGAGDSDSESSEDDRDVKRRRREERSESPSPAKKSRRRSRSRSRSGRRKASRRSRSRSRQRRRSRSRSRDRRRSRS